MKNIIRMGFCICFLVFSIEANVANEKKTDKAHEFNVRELILDHLRDSYHWHIVSIGGQCIEIPLLVIVKGKTSGWHIFSSARFQNKESYRGFSIASKGDYKGKIVETLATGAEVRPWDFSLTKNAFSLLLSSILLVYIILFCADWYQKRKNNLHDISPRGFVAFIEWTIMSVVDDLIKPCIGKNYQRYAPYLLTVFFFIVINNLLGLIPFFPGGANVTGNIAVTGVLAFFTFLMVNLFGTKEYWKEIFWTDIPLWLKVPIPIIPAIELIGVFTKPFSLTIRLFANILAGHAIVLGLTCIIFLTVSLGIVMNTGMTVLSVLMTVFINCVEILVAYIQAYVFIMLSSVFIRFSQIESNSIKNEIKK